MAEGRRPIFTLGCDVPAAMLRAAGFDPVDMDGGPPIPTPLADRLMGAKGLGPRGRRLLERILAPADASVPILITNADTEQFQLFATIRELARLGEASPPPIHFIDLCHQQRESSAAYNRHRLAQLRDWLVSLGGEPAEPIANTPITADAVTAGEGLRLFLAGTPRALPAMADLLAAAGFTVAGTDAACADGRPPAATPPEDVARRIAAAVARAGASHVVHLSGHGDEIAPWDIAALRRALPADILLLTERIDASGQPPFDLLDRLAGRPPAEKPARAPKAPPPKPSARSTRSRKSLNSVADFGTYQREWFAGIRDRVAKGEPFAMTNANAPQEILRALDIPFVVNQWWASIVAAKQQSRRYLGLLRAHDFPGDVEPYSAQGLAAAFDEDADNAPWGGLPRPDFVHAITSSDPTAKIFWNWAQATGAAPYLYERTTDARWDIATTWWEALPERWDEVLEAERIDLLATEIREVIAQLEAATGRTFSMERFVEVMDLVNEQEEYYRRTRDLIARTVPAPIGIVDSMPATMVPQWHRGTEWARDAARAFYEEVAARVAEGAAAVPGEKVRLMWVGRGLWSDMGFYQNWEESHGAVFVWSMYLGLAADGYIRRFDRGRDPIRALAARFLTMGDELRMPSWAAPWHVHEARTHGVDGAVALADADPFVLRALEAAGIPVLDIGMDNFNAEGSDAAEIEARIAAFIEGPAGEKAALRREQAA
ncbi:2-hydroxyacyl-CoA dehydratase family protein [Sphingomonas naphthae]|uniref:2-hydroxyacyl-CoA dehydratase family protein n=1 Tax=Sphingomonas naphthae TaxID=1813468 RepID=A0ABY7TKL0_9SPHN|nr:2-hydroxyacyl-CoA dehydratase family protein [Sphingomonas naphthae]WCT72414.1 2-hydroxyacyl-CoA dehydratase family protein [Sphingomonas naphthae]